MMERYDGALLQSRNAIIEALPHRRPVYHAISIWEARLFVLPTKTDGGSVPLIAPPAGLWSGTSIYIVHGQWVVVKEDAAP